MSRTGAMVLLALAAGAVVSWWLKASVPGVALDQPRELEHADYFMTDFHIRQFNRQGELHYQMRGQRIEHYPADDSAVIDAPALTVSPGQADRWQISARRARAPSRELDEIIFQGDVDMQRPGSPPAGPLTLRTQHLVIRPNAETLSSNEAVVITSPGARIEGRDLQADLGRGIVKLSRVRGRYAP